MQLRSIIPVIFFLLTINIGAHCQCVCTAPGPTLLTNGTFEDPATMTSAPNYIGFQSDYSSGYYIGITGIFRWATNPSNYNTWCNFTNGGHFLLYDGTTGGGPPADRAVAPYDIVRYVNIPVIVGQKYRFGFKATTVDKAGYPYPITITVKIHNTNAGSFMLSPTCNQWGTYEVCWTADTALATIHMNAGVTAYFGYDFAVDSTYFMICGLSPNIVNGDSTALDTVHCYQNVNYSLLGMPGGGTFTGPGIVSQGSDWYFNPVLAAGPNPAFPYYTNITYTLPSGASITRSIMITAPVNVTVGPDQLICKDDFVLSGSVTGNNLVYAWAPSSGLSTPNMPTTSGATNTSNVYTLIAIDTFSKCADTGIVSIAYHKVLAAMTIDNQLCMGDTLTIGNNATGNNLRYYWDMGDNTIVTTAAPPKHVYANSGNYTITLIVADSVCRDTAKELVNVGPVPIVDAGIDQFVCYGMFQLMGKVIEGSNISFAWNPATTLSSPNLASTRGTITNNAQVYYVTGTDIITGCAGTDSVTIYDKSFDAAIVLSKDTVCVYDNFYVSPIIIPQDEFTYSYTWDFGEGNRANGVKATHAYDRAGNHTIVLRAGNEVCTDTATATIYVLDFEMILTVSDTLVEKGSAVTLQAGAAESYDVIAWQPNDMFADQRATAQTVTVDNNTIYTVFGHSRYGCVDSAGVMVNINSIVFIPNAFTPNGDGKNDYFRPVAAGSTIKIKTFEIKDRWGKTVYNTNEGDPLGWDGTHAGQPSALGVYFYYLILEDYSGKSITKKGDVTLIR